MIASVLCLVALAIPAGQLRATEGANLLHGESVPLKADVGDAAWIADLEAFLPALMARETIPGLAIAVIRKGEIAWTGHFGVRATHKEGAVDAATMFQAASLGKPVFAYAVMKLVERGVLELDRPLSDILPGYLEDERVRDITARIVLSHTTGFPNWREGPLQLHFAPGDRFSYSGEGYVYLQKALEHLTGQPLDAIMQDLVFTPLGMTQSSYHWRDAYQDNYVAGHTATGVPIDRRDLGAPKAASTLRTTAGDYARFMIAMTSGAGLTEASWQEMLSPQVPLRDCLNCTDEAQAAGPLSPGNAWGLGWGLQNTAQGLSFWHWGDNGNYKAYAVAFPEQKLGLVYFANSINGLAIRNVLVERAIGGDHPAFHWLTYPQTP